MEATKTIVTDKLLFTPGPLTTSMSVKRAMLRDLGSRDIEFIEVVKAIRSKLLLMGNVSQQVGYESIIMQGSGTFGVEATITSALPKDGNLLIIINGAYGERIAKIADVNHINHTILKYSEDEWPDLQELEHTLANNTAITHVVIVHCETTSGIYNPIEKVGGLCKKYGKVYLVDAMSSFGAVPVDIAACNIDYLVSSSNKCIEGVPGFSFIIAKHETLLKAKGQARSLSLDVYTQWEGLENSGQFRFTPPTHALLAFHQAILEHEEEGGVDGRAARYINNYNTLMAGMRKLGFKEYLAPEKQGYIISSFLYPEHNNFDFNKFYQLLNERDFVIYPGKLSKANAFRIGNIGRIGANDIKNLLIAIQQVLEQMRVVL